MKIFILLYFFMLLSSTNEHRESINFNTIFINAEKIQENKACVFVSKDDGVYTYQNNKLTFFQKDFMPINLNKKNNYIYWGCEEESGSSIKIYDISNNTTKTYNTSINIYDLQLCDNYIIFSGKDKLEGNYKISYIDILGGGETIVSDTQNNQVEFSYFNQEIYFFEPKENNNLYKYNINNKVKTKVSNKIENLTTIKMELCVNECGAFFTKTTDYKNSDLYKLNLNSQELKLIDKNVENLIKIDNNKICLVKADKVVEYNCYNNYLRDILKVGFNFSVGAIQGKFIVLFDYDLSEVCIYEIDEGKELFRFSYFT